VTDPFPHSAARTARAAWKFRLQRAFWSEAPFTQANQLGGHEELEAILHWKPAASHFRSVFEHQGSDFGRHFLEILLGLCLRPVPRQSLAFRVLKDG
jgi:hypothetical protein